MTDSCFLAKQHYPIIKTCEDCHGKWICPQYAEIPDLTLLPPPPDRITIESITVTSN